MSELRQDPISGDWVIIASDRARRPQMLRAKGKPRKPAPKNTCPFEDLEKSGNNVLIAKYPDGKKPWKIAVIPNKYPALTHMNGCAKPFRHGLYLAEAGAGDHQLVITRDHNKSFADLTLQDATNVLEVFRARHQAAAQDSCSIYASTFFNYGPLVGASIWHPHYQFMALPFIPPRITHSLRGEKVYFKNHKRCVRCDIIKEEKNERKRVIAENKFALAFTPYASKRPFEVAIFPKAHLPYFAKTPSEVFEGTAAILQLVLQRMRKYAGDPDLNFFIHDAPVDGKAYPHHHWHIEVVPSISVLGGWEFSTNVDINVVDPDHAAELLRGKK